MTPIDRVSGLIKGSLESIASRWMPSPTPDYDAYTTHNGRLVVDVNNERDSVRIGNVVDQPFFNKGLFTLSQLAAIDAFEDYNQLIHLASGPRTNSGMHPYAHIVEVARILYQNAQIAGVPVMLSDALIHIGHDGIENRKKIIEYTKRLKEIAIQIFSARPDQISHLAEERKYLSRELAKERTAGKEEIKRKFKGIIEESGDYSLITDANTSIRGIIGLTRESDEVPFPLSMGQQLGKGNLEDVFHRAIGKFDDRGANMAEVGLLYSLPNMKQIDLDFGDPRVVDGHVIRKYLSERFGSVNLDARPMTPSQQVHNAFNSLFVFHYFNERINRYLDGVAGGQYKLDTELLRVALFPSHYPTEELSPDLRARLLDSKNRKMQLMRLAIVSRDTAIDTTLKLLESAVSQYETKHGLGSNRDEIEHDIQVLKVTSDFYDRVDLDLINQIFIAMFQDFEALMGGDFPRVFDEADDNFLSGEARLLRNEVTIYRNLSLIVSRGQRKLNGDYSIAKRGRADRQFREFRKMSELVVGGFELLLAERYNIETEFRRFSEQPTYEQYQMSLSSIEELRVKIGETSSGIRTASIRNAAEYLMALCDHYASRINYEFLKNLKPDDVISIEMNLREMLQTSMVLGGRYVNSIRAFPQKLSVWLPDLDADVTRFYQSGNVGAYFADLRKTVSTIN